MQGYLRDRFFNRFIVRLLKYSFCQGMYIIRDIRFICTFFIESHEIAGALWGPEMGKELDPQSGNLRGTGPEPILKIKKGTGRKGPGRG